MPSLGHPYLAEEPNHKFALKVDTKLPPFTDSEKNDYASSYALQRRSRLWPRARKMPSSLQLLILVLMLVFTLFFGQSVVKYSGPTIRGAFRSSKATSHAICNHETKENQHLFIAAAPWSAGPVHAKVLTDRNSWKVECSSSLDNDHDCRFLTDNDGDDTDWQSAHGGSHWVIVDLGKLQNLHSVAVSPSGNFETTGGSVRRHVVQVAETKGSWRNVAVGTWRDWTRGTVNYATFEPQSARYVRLQVVDTWTGDSVAISNLDIYVVPTIPAFKPDEGRWGLTLNFPLVPVTAFLNPTTVELTMLSSNEVFKFGDPNKVPQKKYARTYSATWSPKTNDVRQEIVQEGEHDMFCPGTSFDEKGNVMVTGGVTPNTSSIYDSTTKAWLIPKDVSGHPAQLRIERGYQGQTFLSNGSTFVIGGTWSGGDGNKTGEIYDPITKRWTVLPNLQADFIKLDVVRAQCGSVRYKKCNMSDWQQHHAWLFAWKEDSIFHAGPSKRMNWFFYKPKDGKVEDAGTRLDDNDAVCASTSMYDAGNGAILIAGGATNYHYWLEAGGDGEGQGMGKNAIFRNESTTNAYEIRLGDVQPGKTVKPKKLNSMRYQRIFANAVIFPNGDTLVVGGQQKGEPFHDETWQSVPEIYSPQTGKWQTVAPHSIPRVYHSWAMLLPDARVICGGGGLSDTEETNHYDAQIYYPPYLFKSDGTLADRPVIKSTDSKKYKTGDTIKITTDVDIDGASLIRYSAATHALNNDLRRIKLTPVKDNNSSDKRYTFRIPPDPGVTLPGYWMLFVLKGEVPSVAETVQILAT